MIRRWLTRTSVSKVDAASVGSVEDFKPGTSRIVLLGDEKVIVARSEDGSFHGVSAICTHLGCSIRFEPADVSPEFACNCHDSRFDLDGINLSGPAPGPLRRFEVETRGRELWVLRSGDTDGS
jgi:Rieske Fe-S protein